MAPTPLREIAVCPSQVREHRRFLARNLLPKPAPAQAPRRAPRKLAQELRTPADGRTPPLLMPTGMFEVETIPTATTPLANPMQNVPERSTSRADEPLPHATAERHRPLAQTNDDRTPGRLDHDARAGPGNPRERRTGWVLPAQVDGFAERWEAFDGQARGMAEQAAIWARYSACSDGSDHSGEILLASLSEARGRRGWKGSGRRGTEQAG
jgi:hypothetical protein